MDATVASSMLSLKHFISIQDSPNWVVEETSLNYRHQHDPAEEVHVWKCKVELNIARGSNILAYSQSLVSWPLERPMEIVHWFQYRESGTLVLSPDLLAELGLPPAQ